MSLRRFESIGRSAARSRPGALRPQASSFTLPVLLLGGLHLASLAVPHAAAAAPAPRSLSQDTTGILQLQPIKASAPSPHKRALLRPSFWEPVREQAHRIREPDPGILRYTLRYAISPDLAKQIHDASTREGIDPDLAFRLIRVESRFAPRARSPMGALGLMQLMPGTARRLDPSLKSEAQILDPRNNLRLGLRYLRGMIERYDDVRLGLLAYNRGPNAVDRALRQGRDPENGYSGKVLGGSSRYRGPGLLPSEPRS